ncbi:MAG: glycosyltransferase family 2 protein [Candidatus Shapirobacteria bacterium]|jgi:glycosyltransferase involved in cell wall biosynthesis
MSPITILLLTKNESENIKKYWGWVGECPNINQIVVVDDFSTDDTLTQISKLKTKNLKVDVFQRHLDNNFSAQRQFALTKAKNNWILWLDADEKPSPELIRFINKTQFLEKVIYSFPRQDQFLGQILKHGETANQVFLRLFLKNSGHFVGAVHEVWSTNLTISKVNSPIFHFPHQNLTGFFQKINFYTDIKAQELYQQKIKTNIFQIIFYPILKFKQNYIFRLGFLDSTAGMILALGMSFHSFLVRAKLWHLWSQRS